MPKSIVWVWPVAKSQPVGQDEGEPWDDSSSRPRKKKKRGKPRLGTGAWFEQLKEKLASRGAEDPEALAAWIGRKKFGGSRYAKLSAAGR